MLKRSGGRKSGAGSASDGASDGAPGGAPGGASPEGAEGGLPVDGGSVVMAPAARVGGSVRSRFTRQRHASHIRSIRRPMPVREMDSATWEDVGALVGS